MNNSRNQSLIIYALLFIAIAAMVFYQVQPQGVSEEDLTLNQLAQDVQGGKVTSIVVDSDNILTVSYTDAAGEITKRTTQKEEGVSVVDTLINLGVSQEALSPDKIKIEIEGPSMWLTVFSVIVSVLPFVLMFGMFWWIFRQAQGSNNQAMSFGKSRARMFNGERPTVTFEDVAGADESKEELKEVVEFLKEPQKFIQLGARIPKGVLLVGPPGTG